MNNIKEMEKLIDAYLSTEVCDFDKWNAFDEVKSYIETDGYRFTVIKRGSEVIVRALMGDKQYEGVARCNPEDEFDFKTGFKTAYMRMFDKSYNTEDNFKPHLENKQGDNLGDIGELTPLYDTRNEQLRVGDVVEVYWLRKPFGVEDKRTLVYVCKDTKSNNYYLDGYYSLTLGKEIKGFILSRLTDMLDYSVRKVTEYDKVKHNTVYNDVTLKKVDK